MLKSCIGIHRTYCETNNCKEIYIQVCNLRLYKEGHRFFSKYVLPNCDNQIKAELLASGYNFYGVYHLLSDVFLWFNYKISSIHV